MGLGTKIGAEDSDGASMSSNAKIVFFSVEKSESDS